MSGEPNPGAGWDAGLGDIGVGCNGIGGIDGIDGIGGTGSGEGICGSASGVCGAYPISSTAGNMPFST